GLVGLPALRPLLLQPLQRRPLRYDDSTRVGAGRVGGSGGGGLSHAAQSREAPGSGENEFHMARRLASVPVMRWEFFDDPGAFLAVSGDLLAADPLVSTVLAGVTERAVRELAAG